MKDPILLNKLWKEVEAGRVAASSSGSLTIFKYTQETHIKDLWNDVNRQARGIIFDVDGTVVARPFSKFFNLHERPETNPDNLPWSEGCEVYEKVDGCFEYNTPILLSDGTYKTIGEIVNRKLNASVMGWDFSRSCLVATPIRDWFKYRDRDDWLEITIDYPYTLKSGGGTNGIDRLKVTRNHKFWCGDNYRTADELDVGDTIYCYDEQLTDAQKSFILGSLLGDSSICKSGKHTGVFQGSNKEEEYVAYKKQILGNLSHNDIPITSGFGTKMFRYRSSRMRQFGKWRQEWYPDETKIVPKSLSWLDDIAVAFWYMDDGSLSHSDKQQDRAVFATNGFTKEDCQRLAKMLESMYGVNTTVFDSKGWNIRINAGRNQQIDYFWLRITPHVHPSMRYKLPQKYRDLYFQEITNQLSWPGLSPFTVTKVEGKIPRNRTAYDFETDTHNYFAKGVLVHNSCGTGYRHGGRWKLATPGSMESDQAVEGTEILNEKTWQADSACPVGDNWWPRYHLEHLPVDCTPVFEIIYPDNRIVVDYRGSRELVLLAIFEHNGIEWHPRRVDQIAELCGFRRPKRYDIDIRHSDIFFEDNSEGYVARFGNGFRVKIKSPTYLRIHRLLNHLSPKGVVELIRGKEYRVTVQQLPQEIAKDFDDVRAHVQGIYNAIFTAAFENLRRLREEVGVNQSRKVYAEWIIANVPNMETGFVFALLDDKDIEDKVWKLVLEKVQNETGSRTIEAT